jgi:hypothetical protein
MLALGCGRIGFDPSGGVVGDGGDDGGMIDAPSTGPAGPRWVRGFGPSTGGSLGVMVTGAGGEAVAVKSFQTSLAIEGMTLTGQAPFGSGAVVRYDAAGTIVSTSILDATGYCDPRGVAMRGDEVLVTGLTIGTTTNPAFGACSIATNRQDPFVVRVERNGTQHLSAHWIAAGGNGQGWRVAPMSDGTMVMSGIYAVDLTIGSPLPRGTIDPSTFLTRFMDGVSAPNWAVGLTSTVSELHAGPVATDANDTCTMGGFNAPVTLFGQALPHRGSYDAWVARLDPSGTPRWIRAIATTGEDSSFGESSITAAPDGGCYVAMLARGDLAVDAVSLPASDGNAVVLHLDATGMVDGGLRMPSVGKLARVGTKLYVAAEVSTPLTSGTITYTPIGFDVVIAELDMTTGIVGIVGALGGAGDQRLWSFAAIAGDALAIGAHSTGELVFGPFTSNSGAADVNVVAVIGL